MSIAVFTSSWARFHIPYQASRQQAESAGGQRASLSVGHLAYYVQAWQYRIDVSYNFPDLSFVVFTFLPYLHNFWQVGTPEKIPHLTSCHDLIRNNLVALLEALFARIDIKFEVSVFSEVQISSRLTAHIYTCLLCTHTRIHICNMCNLYTYKNTNLPKFSSSGFSGPSKCLVSTPGLTSSTPCAVCVCAYTHTYIHKIEKHKTNPHLSFCQT